MDSAILTETPTSTDQASKSRRRLPMLLALFAAIVSVLLVSGCHYMGSGTTLAQDGQHNATFTFNLTCDSSTGESSGLLTYTDTHAGVLINGSAPRAANPGGCAKFPGLFNEVDTFKGTYTALKTGLTGNFTLKVTEGGTNTTVVGSKFDIKFETGPYAGYHNSGPVLKGNIVQVG